MASETTPWLNAQMGSWGHVARRRTDVVAAVTALVLLLVGMPTPAPAEAGSSGHRGAVGAVVPVIVQATSGALEAAADAVEAAGGTITDALPIIEGFAARVPAGAVERLVDTTAVRAVTPDEQVHFENLTYDETTTASSFAKASGAPASWTTGALGQGVGVAVIDTGISSVNDFAGRLVHGPDLSGEGTTVDTYGHGTVMAGLIGGSGADSATRSGGAYTGVAPQSTLVSVKVAGRNGVTDVSTVLEAMHWVSAYKDQFNIKVVNLSWGVTSQQDPAVDPLNYAVQRLWGQGITVVVAAGNSGPDAGTITKPADDPAVLTVGAFDDGQDTNTSNDNVPKWSSRGPTAQGLTKPDLVAPGRTLVSTRSFGSAVESENPKALISPSYIKGSGSSQAAAVTSGLAALLVQQRPAYTPDQVKRAFVASASPIGNTATTMQGAGRINLSRALAADPGAAVQQTLTASGLGSLEASRGGRNVSTDCFMDGTLDVIKGEITDKCVPWDGKSWTGNSWTGNSWTGNSWTGNSWTGNSWTGNSWTNATWTGNSWTGGTWSGNSWTGNSWTGNSWTGNSWTGNSWTGNSWTGSGWTTAEYGEPEIGFLTSWWGNRPKWSKHVPGEQSEPMSVFGGLVKIRVSFPVGVGVFN
jgi:serine protease AprX